MSNLVLGIIIAILIIVYILLKRSQHQDDNLPAMSQSNLPAVSEDVNLPVVNEVKPLMKNEPLDDDRPQQ